MKEAAKAIIVRIVVIFAMGAKVSHSPCHSSVCYQEQPIEIWIDQDLRSLI